MKNSKNLKESDHDIFSNKKKERKKTEFEKNYNTFFIKKDLKKSEYKDLTDSYLKLYYKDKNEEKKEFLDNYMIRRKDHFFNTKNIEYPDKMDIKLNNCFDDIHSVNYFKRITDMKYNLEIGNLIDRVVRRSEKSLEAILQEHEFT